MKRLLRVNPTEDNGYCFFEPQLEADENVFFHATKERNLEPILRRGFLSGRSLDSGDLIKTYFASKSSGCFANLGWRFSLDQVVFAVRFITEQLESDKITKTSTEVHVCDVSIQPKILGYIEIKKGFKW